MFTWLIADEVPGNIHLGQHLYNNDVMYEMTHKYIYNTIHANRIINLELLSTAQLSVKVL